MGVTQFAEAVSLDPYVRELHRRAVRLLNDPALDREQRVFHIRRLQGLLLAHQAALEGRAQKGAATRRKAEPGSRSNRSDRFADQSHIVVKRPEFSSIVVGSKELAVEIGSGEVIPR